MTLLLFLSHFFGLAFVHSVIVGLFFFCLIFCLIYHFFKRLYLMHETLYFSHCLLHEIRDSIKGDKAAISDGGTGQITRRNCSREDFE